MPVEERKDQEENTGTINTISGGLAAGGSSGQSREAYAREVCITSQPPSKKKKTGPMPTISFSDDDLKDTKTPHDDLLVITIKAGTLINRLKSSKHTWALRLYFQNHFLKKTCFLYLSITKVAVSTVLSREEDGVQKPIYYVSKVLQDVETRYAKIGKIALALIISTRHLQPYFQSHTIVILMEQPLRKVLLSPEASGRMVNLFVELGEFDIQNKPRTTIKSQALADFIVECTLPEDPPQLILGVFYVDGSSAIGSSGAGIILISLEGFMVEYALHFGFQASNNEVEYEALLAGIRLAHALKKDAIEFIQRCDKCQKFAPVSYTPVAPLTSVISPIPFAIWGMDLPGSFPVTYGQQRFVIVAIDYFTKWTEAESLATITSVKCEDLFWKNMVCHFGVPKALVIDNEKQFDNSNFRNFCTNLSIDLRFTFVAHPQSNGQTENMNRSILQGLKKKLDEAKGAWVDELPKEL
ncbi:hypothetical protein RJ639_015023 [Escallonia herrerae]|uniref:Integrase catalytic domain-containing protein n=1 Tax=Escallonia herrerae TaxID=1293975 RepID=A0AA88VKL2_9ASTE|nr:hypothetical protein RJ639_015023 [Escallonia herrerae]